ncbi:hypothetical protein BDP27DRAFT_834345 [Rhodocollybia butyracea]|uniref:Uncharacterized protein n=1 Tax=Rhodocollybia butyracea TaxID=206335 RepID=A0A9P5PUC0_9AGAR|nr:hypothetical protein BDP27DRAFT_834345 [Rhodocollybia butyracea]
MRYRQSPLRSKAQKIENSETDTEHYLLDLQQVDLVQHIQQTSLHHNVLQPATLPESMWDIQCGYRSLVVQRPNSLYSNIQSQPLISTSHSTPSPMPAKEFPFPLQADEGPQKHAQIRLRDRDSRGGESRTMNGFFEGLFEHGVESSLTSSQRSGALISSRHR